MRIQPLAHCMNSAAVRSVVSGPSHAAQPRLRPRCSAQADSEERVFACDLPTPKEEDPVYACLLPEPSPPRWQFWRRAAPPARAAPTPRAEDELSRLSTSRARWEEQRARLQTVAECFRTADLARACGDFETASRLRDYAAQWALLGAGGESDSREAAPVSRDVLIDIRQLGGGMREVWAAVEVAAPAEVVWRTLTDYERLADIVPSLEENRVLERWQGGVRLQQVAAQDLAFGIKFSATATLDIEELPEGIPAAGAAPPQAAKRPGAAVRRVTPRSMGQPPKSVRDICFTLVESADLRRFTGTWRIESRDNMRSRLIYAVEVLPQPWLPVGLIAKRISADLVGNLGAVRDHAEVLSIGAVAINRGQKTLARAA